MKIKRMFSVFLIAVISVVCCACCDGCTVKAIELMGAGDRIHDSYTFANVGTKIKDDGENKYTIYGSVDKLSDENVKTEFKIASDINYIVAIKLTSINTEVVKDEVEIYIDGARNYDAEHLNGSTYTFILLEAKADATATISVKWNSKAETLNYTIYFDSQLELK